MYSIDVSTLNSIIRDDIYPKCVDSGSSVAYRHFGIIAVSIMEAAESHRQLVKKHAEVSKKIDAVDLLGDMVSLEDYKADLISEKAFLEKEVSEIASRLRTTLSLYGKDLPYVIWQ